LAALIPETGGYRRIGWLHRINLLVLLCHVFANRFQLADNQRHAVGCQAMATKYPTV
jgi:hypothetical protein